MLKQFVAVLPMAAVLQSAAFGAAVTIGASKDATIFGTAAGADTGNASGKGPALFAGTDGTGNRKRSLIEFDVASAGIPAGATIDSATLTLYLAQVAGSAGGGGGGGGGGGSFPSRTLRLYDLLQDWGEGKSGSPTSPTLTGAGPGYPRVTGDSTWYYALFNAADPTSGKWTAAGTDLHGGNFAPVETASSTFTTFSPLNSPFTWSSSAMAADVQAWIDGAKPNDGWLLKSDLEDSPTSFLGFWSKDGAAANNNPAIAPSLTVTYSVPEPAGGFVLASIIPGLLARRRRTVPSRSSLSRPHRQISQ